MTVAMALMGMFKAEVVAGDATWPALCELLGLSDGITRFIDDPPAPRRCGLGERPASDTLDSLCFRPSFGYAEYEPRNLSISPSVRIQRDGSWVHFLVVPHVKKRPPC